MDTGQVQAGRSGLVYAALGDSMSIDHYAGGPGRGAASLLWRNRDDDFPAWAGHDLTAHHPAVQLALLAGERVLGGGDPRAADWTGHDVL